MILSREKLFSKSAGQEQKITVTPMKMVSYMSHPVVGQAWDKRGTKPGHAN